jgi:hypothetical protein
MWTRYVTWQPRWQTSKGVSCQVERRVVTVTEIFVFKRFQQLGDHKLNSPQRPASLLRQLHLPLPGARFAAPPFTIPSLSSPLNLVGGAWLRLRSSRRAKQWRHGGHHALISSCRSVLFRRKPLGHQFLATEILPYLVSGPRNPGLGAAAASP